ncbi:TetR/AcrR family transcriptional regulator [Pseudoduganella sp. LjRoot289]|uniref:TetR/AcrR family transcriptional regulator n=1 Tax=Pseudoduganella sp. LjRoot289 TaxID=3342314 RepID=UPI003ED11F91
MRKSNAETAETRKRIIAMASRAFLRHGFAGAGIADIMVAAGLTQGGFYRHFESKEQLIAEASAAAFAELGAMFEAATAGKPPREAVEGIVQLYLHQLQAEELILLCPLANLAGELHHADAQIRTVASGGYAGLVKLIAAPLTRMDVADSLGLAESIVSLMVGAVSLSRVVGAEACEPILANARNTVNLLLDSAGKIVRQ